MLTLKLFPIEFRVMIGFLRFTTDGQDQVPLAAQYLPTMILLQYLKTWKAHRLLAWQAKRTDREYKLSLPLPVAKALHQEMQAALLTGHQQLLLIKLDQAVVNYRDPHSHPQLLGEFFSQP